MTRGRLAIRGAACARAPAVAGALVLCLGIRPAQMAQAGSLPLPSEAAQVGRDFLAAFCRNDRDAIEAMIPREVGGLYGPSPFSRMPSLTKPRADGRVAAVDFEGKMADPGLPNKGTIILRLVEGGGAGVASGAGRRAVEEGGVKAWRVRQIYWYERLPPEADIPDESPTQADRKQEAKAREAAKDFLHYWLAGDFKEVDARVFHWWQVDRRPPKWVQMTGAHLEARTTNLGGIRVDFTVKLKVLRVVPKSVSGTFWMVQEQVAAALPPQSGASAGRGREEPARWVWRVRPLTFAFFF
jgi:hypothetical protein